MKRYFCLFTVLAIMAVHHRLDAIFTIQAAADVTGDVAVDMRPFENVTVTSLEQLPGKYKEKFTLIYPEVDLTIIKPVVKVKGSNRFRAPVFVNGKQLRVRNDGRFFEDVALTDDRQQDLFISFIAPDYTIHTVTRQLIRLRQPKDIEKVSKHRRELTYFFNSHFIHAPQSKALSDYVTRADMAYFLAQLTEARVSTPAIAVLNDVEPRHWESPYVQFVLDNHIMSEFPDGTFRSKDAIRTIDFVMSMVRALRLPLDKKQTALPYADISTKHWTAKFVRTARNNQLIPASGELHPNRKVTWAQFVSLVQNYDAIEMAFDRLRRVNEAGDIPPAYLEPIRAYLTERKQETVEKTKLTVESPAPLSTVFEQNVRVVGQMSPAEEFWVNGEAVLPDMLGHFSINVALNPGVNRIPIRAFGNEQELVLHRLEPYEDLKNHWVAETAGKLRHLGIFPDARRFSPKTSCSRGYFADILAKAFQYSEPQAADPVPSDVSEDSPYFRGIKAVLEKNILNKDAQGLFNPNKLMSKAEAITAIVRACNFSLPQERGRRRNLFLDVKGKHWVRPYLLAAVDQNLISEASYFHPNKPITKAQLAAILSKTPKLQQRLSDVFQ